MELGGNEGGNASRSFAMDMSKDFIPMTVFSDSTQGIHVPSFQSSHALVFDSHDIII
jgi:transcription initiation factor TFIIF subunit beta